MRWSFRSKPRFSVARTSAGMPQANGSLRNRRPSLRAEGPLCNAKQSVGRRKHLGQNSQWMNDWRAAAFALIAVTSQVAITA